MTDADSFTCLNALTRLVLLLPLDCLAPDILFANIGDLYDDLSPLRVKEVANVGNRVPVETDYGFLAREFVFNVGD